MIDNKDFSILEILRKNSRTKVRDIARKLRVPVTTVHKRIKKMEEDGIIKGYMTSVDYEKLGFNISAYILIKADYPKLKKMKLTYGYFLDDVLKNLPNASIASLITGHERDMIVRIRAKNIDELNKCLDALRGITGVLATDTMIILGEGRRTSAIR